MSNGVDSNCVCKVLLFISLILSIEIPCPCEVSNAPVSVYAALFINLLISGCPVIIGSSIMACLLAICSSIDCNC